MPVHPTFISHLFLKTTDSVLVRVFFSVSVKSFLHLFCGFMIIRTKYASRRTCTQVNPYAQTKEYMGPLTIHSHGILTYATASHTNALKPDIHVKPNIYTCNNEAHTHPHIHAHPLIHTQPHIHTHSGGVTTYPSTFFNFQRFLSAPVFLNGFS